MDLTSTARRWMLSGLLALAALLLAVWPVPADAATTFTVNRTRDVKDRNLGDGVCDARLTSGVPREPLASGGGANAQGRCQRSGAVSTLRNADSRLRS
jgi:hypothetical protein